MFKSMKKLSALFLSAVLTVMLINGCGKKEEPIVDVKGYSVYTDPEVDFSIKYPSNWLVQKYPGFRLIAYTSREAAGRFRTYESEGVPGAKMEIYAVKLDSNITIDSVMKMKFFESNIYKDPVPVTIDGIQGVKQTYAFELNDGIVEGTIYYFVKDPHFATIIDFEAFKGNYSKYAANFDEILKSAKLAVMPTKVKKDSVQVKEAEPPSTDLTSVSGDGFSMQVPMNFEQQNVSTPGALKAYNFIGERRADGNIRVDIFDASKQSDLDKIIKANAGKYKGAAPTATSLGGKKAYVFEYMPVAKVKSRVYFAVSNNRLYRVTVNWPTDEEQNYKPVFERSIKSLKIK
jgi:hypothetical protein